MAATKPTLTGRAIFLLLTTGFLGFPIQAKYGGGVGTLENPYLIFTAEHLKTVATEPDDWNKHFRLMADVDLEDSAGGMSHFLGELERPFTGTFDGNAHTISHFTCIRPDADNVGLFGYVLGIDAQIKNLGLIDPNVHTETGDQVGALVGRLQEGTVTCCYVRGGRVSGHQMVGGLVGRNHGTVINCFVEGGTVSGDYYVGGLVGHAHSGSIIECHAASRVMGYYRVGGLIGSNRAAAIVRCRTEGSTSNGAPIGGLVGQNISGAITDCYATGAVAGRGAGGLVGDNSGTLLRCHATGGITGGGGGLVGTNDGTVADCYATGGVSGSGHVGGLAGRNHDHGVIRNCHATGAVRSDGTAGGLTGFSSGLIANSCASGAVTGGDTTGGLAGLTINGLCVNCYSTGDVTGQRYTGGLIGLLNGKLSHCYAVGRVKGTEDAGGLVGNGGSQSVEDCFWDIQTSEQTAGVNGDGRTTAQLQTSHTFLAAGWDFIGETTNGVEDIWWILEGEDYPRLYWELGEDR